jgi:hypothetical protein
MNLCETARPAVTAPRHEGEMPLRIVRKRRRIGRIRGEAPRADGHGGVRYRRRGQRVLSQQADRAKLAPHARGATIRCEFAQTHAPAQRAAGMANRGRGTTRVAHAAAFPDRTARISSDRFARSFPPVASSMSSWRCSGGSSPQPATEGCFTPMACANASCEP